MIEKSCFFMLCTNSTEEECLTRNLFGEREWALPYLKTIKIGDIGFLLNVSKDELLGIFIAKSEAALNIEPEAWGGEFPAQIKVELIGELQRISNASQKLKDFLELKKVDRGAFSYFVTKMKTYGPDITNKVLSLFIIPTNFESELQELKATSASSEFSLANVAGLDEIKQFVYQRIIAPFEDEERAYRLKLKIGGGILLVGPPGTGKTLISQAIAKSIEAKFIEISPSVIAGYPGEAEKRLEKIFDDLKKEPRAVLFLDEAEWILSERTGEGSTIMTRLKPLLLSLLGKIFKERTKPIIVIAATNKPELIDPAFLRPGRFDRVFYVRLPNEQARIEILKLQLKDRKHNLRDEDIKEIAKKLEGYSGADIENIVDEASFKAFEKKDIIKKEFILDAINRIPKSVGDEEIQRYEEWARNRNLLGRL
ncbi:MAG: AAA family ATPase [Candidatus Omnitrophica bacterium]|nr:AAA family ATPase [Candidatus Omnitrophota bacterium]